MVSSSAENKFSVKILTISDDLEGQRIDNFLMSNLKGVPRTRVYRIVRKGEVRVNKGRVKPSYRLMAGDLVRIPPIRVSEQDTSKSFIPVRHPLVSSLLETILYEDDHLLILNKPSGLAVHGGSGVSFGVIEALRILRPKSQSLELVHRLDRDTSGCLMIAKRRSALRVLHQRLREGVGVEKIYWALVEGDWRGPSCMEEPLIKNQLKSGERIVKIAKNGEGQAAITHFKVLERYKKEATLLEAKPITGRTHQIRVHAAQAGYPVVGDLKYGNESFNASMKTLGFSRLFLHARQLTLKLPGTDQVLTIEAPLDPMFSNLLNRLSKEKIND